MAQIEYSVPVDKIHGKVAKSHKIGFAHRKASKRNYSVEYGKRSTPATSSEIAHRTKFATARANVKALTPTEIDAYKAAFKADKQGYKCLQGYIFAQEYAKIGV